MHEKQNDKAERAPVSAGGDAVLPCDVLVAPATIVGKGCKVSTLMSVIEGRRENPPELTDEQRANLRKLLNVATPAPPVGADWTDEQCIAFMAVALRHTEYKRGNGGPTLNEIRQGVRRALMLAAAPTPAEARGVGGGELSKRWPPLPTQDDVRAAIDLALSDAAKAVKVLSTILRKKELQGFVVADEILGSIINAQTLEAALAANKPAGEDRRVLTEALADLDVSTWECPQCGHSEDCATMDVAHMIRAHLDDTRQAQAQGSEAVMVPREFIASLRDSFEAINNDDDGEIYMNESCDAMDRIDELLAAHAQAGEGSNG